MSTPEAKGVHPFVEPMSMTEFFEEAKRLGVRMLGAPEETCVALQLADRMSGELSRAIDWRHAAAVELRRQHAEIERLTAERDALVRQNHALCDAMGYSARKHELDSPEEHAARLLFERDSILRAVAGSGFMVVLTKYGAHLMEAGKMQAQPKEPSNG